MHFALLLSKLLRFFIPKNIDKIATDTGFMKRHSKILPTTFAKALTFGLLDEGDVTEESIALKCSHLQSGVSVSKQAIKKKLKGAIPFLKTLLTESFELMYSTFFNDCLNPLKQIFSDIKILDATTISLPDIIEESYKGLGGKNAKSALKIQVVYSAFKQCITNFNITSATVHDHTYLESIKETLSDKDLFLADLGYFDLSFFKELGESKYFISRFKTNATFYECYSEKCNLFEPVDFKEILSTKEDYIDRIIYIGKHPSKRIKVRIVGEKLPAHVAAKRIQKAITASKGNELSKEKRLMLHWNLMITNVGKDMISSSIILSLYRLRWQIELLFKCLKSHLKLDKMHVGKTEYVEALLYGRLIATLLTMPVYHELDQIMLKTKGRGISMQRFYRLMLVDLHIIYDSNTLSYHKVTEVVEFFKKVGNLSLNEKRKSKTTMEQLWLDLSTEP